MDREKLAEEIMFLTNQNYIKKEVENGKNKSTKH